MIKKLPIPYIYCILIGVTVGLILGLKSYLSFMYWGETEKYSWIRYFSPHFINNALWGFLVPLVYHFMNRYSLSKSAPAKQKIKAVIACLSVAAFHEMFSYVVWFFPADWLGYYKFNMEEFKYVVGAFPSGFISRIIEYWIIYGIFTAIDYSKKYRDKQIELAQLETQLSNAQLNALRLQLHPHFLFNTLNTISSLVDISKKDAQKMISQLGNLLRTVLDKNKKQTIPLGEELEFIKNYLSIEQVRFHDRLEVNYDVDPELVETRVPSMILQPLVENAIKHGFSKRTDAGRIEVSAKKINGQKIELKVSDDGVGSEDKQEDEMVGGIGLKNVKDRLQLIYKTEASMEIHNAPGKRFEVKMFLPAKIENHAQN